MTALVPAFLDQLAEAEAYRAELGAQLRSATTSTDDDPDETEQISSAELARLKKELMAANKQYKALQSRLLFELEAERAALSANHERNLVLGILRDHITSEVHTRIDNHRLGILAVLQSWQVKYAASLHSIEQNRDGAISRLNALLKELGYA